MMSRLSNGYRRAVASVLAAVTLAVLVLFALLVMIGNGRLGAAETLVFAIFLGLHTFALTWLLGASPWNDILRVLDLLAAGGHPRDRREPPRDGGPA